VVRRHVWSATGLPGFARRPIKIRKCPVIIQRKAVLRWTTHILHVYDCAGQKELLRCTADLGIGDIDVYQLSSHAVRNVVFDNF